MANDAVNIPINLEVTDLDLSKVNPKDLEKGLQSQLKGAKNAFEKALSGIDTKDMSANLKRTAQQLHKTFRDAESSVQSFSKAVKDAGNNNSALKSVEDVAKKTAEAFGDLSKAYDKFNTTAEVEAPLTKEFSNTLEVTHRLMNELALFKTWSEQYAQNSDTSAESWEKLDILTKSTGATVKTLLADMREMVKTGDAFKLGQDSGLRGEWLHNLASMQGTLQGGFLNATNFNINKSGHNASQELIDARTKADQLAAALEVAKNNADDIKVDILTNQLAMAEAEYERLYDAAYGVAEVTEEAAASVEQITASASTAANGMYMSDAAAVKLFDTLNTIVELLERMGSTGKDAGNQIDEGMERASNKVDKTKDSARNLQQAFSAARNVMTATVMTLNQFGTVGTMIAQVIGIVQLLADAFRDVATASHSIIPIIGIFLGLAVNVFGRIISLVKKLLGLLKQIGLAILSVAQKIGNVLGSAVKKFGSGLASIIPSKDMLKKVTAFFSKYLLGFRSSYFLIRKIRQVVIDGLKELAIAAPEFHEQMNQFSTALNQVKGSLVSAFQPIVSFVVPALTQLFYALSKVLTLLAKFNAVLVGQDYYYDYAAAMQDYADGIGGVGKAAKKAQRDLMGFDEINRLSAPNDPSGSGSGLGGEFIRKDVAETEDAISRFARLVRESWLNGGDFTMVGNVVSDTMDNWIRIFDRDLLPKADSFLQKLSTSAATFINGFTEESFGSNVISGLVFGDKRTFGEDIGKTIADIFNMVFRAIDNFLTTTHWDSVGKFVGDVINGAFQNFNWSKFFITISNFFNSMFEFIGNAARTIEWANIGSRIADGLIDGLMNFDAEKAGHAIHDFFKGIFDAINSFVDKMGQKQMRPVIGGRGFKFISGWELLGEKLKQFIDNLDLDDLAFSAGKAISGIIEGGARMLTAADLKTSIESISDSFMKGMGEHDWQTALQTLWDQVEPKITQFFVWLGPRLWALLKKLWNFIRPAVVSLGKDLAGAIFDGLIQGITEWNATNIMETLAKVLLGGDLTDLLGPLGKVIDVADGDSLFNGNGVAGAAASDKSKKKSSGKSSGSGLFDFIVGAAKDAYETTSGFITDATDLFMSMPFRISTSLAPLPGVVGGIFGNSRQAAEDNFSVSQVSGYYNDVWESIVESFYSGKPEDWFADKFTASEEAIKTAMTDTSWAQQTWNGITEVFDQAPSYFEESFRTAKEQIIDMFKEDGDMASTLTSSVDTTLTSVMNSFVDGINNAITNPFNKMDSAMSTLRSFSIGGVAPFMNIPRFSFPKIPKLAQGAVLPPNQPFLSVVGDQKSGTNIEAPLDTIKQAVAEVLNENQDLLVAGFEAVVQAIQDKRMDVIIGDRVIGEAANRYNANQQRVMGV